ncbi:MAG: methylated-DNA--[protein]-cysteine S-methyltransferase [Candidatus Phytoplasma sp.]|nr:methylated-DNA--[protein]-cysteine S-methyltransferase [Phytoplasma sp.]
MIYTQVTIHQNSFYIGIDQIGITFIGSPNGDKEEIKKWFKDVTYVSESHQITEIKKQLTSYFNKEATSIDIPIHMIGTDFQKEVWSILLEIPYGETKSYLDIANKLNSPKKVRAVAHAIAKNPLLMIVPCHRVIGSNGNLTGYRAGLEFKKELLTLESLK